MGAVVSPTRICPPQLPGTAGSPRDRATTGAPGLLARTEVPPTHNSSATTAQRVGATPVPTGIATVDQVPPGPPWTRSWPAAVVTVRWPSYRTARSGPLPP